MTPRSPRSHRRLPDPATGLGLVGRPVLAMALAVVVAAVVAVVVAPAIAGGPVAATTIDPLDCGAVVVDTSGQVDVAAVEAAADRIDRDRIGPGATVVVRVWADVGDGGVIAAVDELVGACFDDGQGGVADEIAIIGLAVGDSESDVLLGGRWVVAVPDAAILRSEVLGEALVTSDLTGALVAVLDEMARGVIASAPPPTSTTVTSSTPTTSTTQATEGDESPAADGAGDRSPAGDEASPVPTVAEVPGEADDAVDSAPARIGSDDGPSTPVVIGAVLAIGLCGAAVVAVHRQLRAETSRNGLRQRLTIVGRRLDAVGERHRQLRDQADDWYRTTAGRARTAVGERRRAAATAAATTRRADDRLLEAVPGGLAGIDELAGSAFGPVGERLAALSRAVDTESEALDDLAALVDHLDHLEVALPARAGVLAGELPALRELIDTRTGADHDVAGIRADLAEVAAAVDDVEDSIDVSEVDLLDLSDALHRAEAIRFALADELDATTRPDSAIRRCEAQLVEAIAHQLNRVDLLRGHLAAAATVHPSAAWHWSVGHPDDAVAAIDRAADLAERAGDLLRSAGPAEEAGRLLAEAGVELVAADRLLDEVDDLLVDLEWALADAPGSLARVRPALWDLLAALASHRADDMAEFHRRHEELTAVVAGLEVELARSKTNHAEVVEVADEVGRDLDRLVHLIAAAPPRPGETRAELDRQLARAARSVARARRSLGWLLVPSALGASLDRLDDELVSLATRAGTGANHDPGPSHDPGPDKPVLDLAVAVDAVVDIADDALRIQEHVLARRRRQALGLGTGHSVVAGPSWSLGGAARRNDDETRPRPGRRASAGRPFSGRAWPARDRDRGRRSGR